MLSLTFSNNKITDRNWNEMVTAKHVTVVTTEKYKL